MLLQAAVLLFATSLLQTTEAVSECVNADTSEGPRTLQHGQVACAPLQVGESLNDLGKRFIICSHGSVIVQSCSSSLRYDTVAQTCTWAESATCCLEEAVSKATSTTISKSSQTAVIATVTATPSDNSTRNTTDTFETTNQEAFTDSTIKSTTQATPTIKPTTRPPPTIKPTTRPPPTGPCNPTSCKLPNCFCYGSSPNMPMSDTPMFIMLTFDDAITTTVYNFFKSLLVDNSFNIRNPNGCPIRAAFYVNHQYTDYGLLKSLADKGNEIASHTVNHSLPQGDSSAHYPLAVAEIVGMRDKVLEGTGDKSISDSMVGFRAPYLRVAHNVQFDALVDNGFLYDTSVTNIETSSGRSPLWPYTLDYVMPLCTNLPCPTKPYPGFWEVPINGWVGSNGYGCSMIDVCSVGSNIFTASEKEWYDFYKTNFDSYFYPVKVPMQMFTHGSMFLRSPPSYPALISWFQDLQLTHRDMWIVTPTMVIEWMKNPLTNSQMIAQKWGCL